MTNPGNKESSQAMTPEETRLWGCFLCSRLSHMANRCGIHGNCGHYYVRAEAVAERCAPLVEFATYVSRVWEGAHLGDSALAALAAYDAAQGAGRGT
jgi:hypothetical protein